MILYVLDDDRTERVTWERIVPIKTDWICYTFERFENLQAAFQCGYPPDIILIDYIMPDCTGVDVCKWLQQYHPGIRKFIVTGKFGDEFEILANAIADGYISKELDYVQRLDLLSQWTGVPLNASRNY